jgi:aconitate hydratase
MNYLDRAGLLPPLRELGFDLVGYGCTTCIGNSRPLPGPVSRAIANADLAVGSVLSGNRNFEGRIHPETKLNYLASPPLVVAYALTGSMGVDLTHDPLGVDPHGQPVPERHLAQLPADRPDHRLLRAPGDVPTRLRRRVHR